MKAYNKLALAILATTAAASVNAGVTVTPLILGYHVSNDIKDTAKKQRKTLNTGVQTVTDAQKNQANNGITGKGNGVALDSDLYVGAGIGIELTPTIALELEYGEKNTDAFANKKAKEAGIAFDAKQKMYSANLAVGTETFTGYTNSPFKPYVLVGAGVSDISVKAKKTDSKLNVQAGQKYAQSKDTIGNVGLGAYYRINDALSLRGEARAVHNFDNNWWEGMALAGLNVALGGHLAPAAPVVEPTIVPADPVVVEPVEPVEPVVVDVVEEVDGDDDQDGVPNSVDQCLDTPLNVVVDEIGCPVEKVIDDQLRMELRVFFDNDKTTIKDQYRPEIQKVAEKMNEYSNATAAIEGHASKNNKRSSATYNQRLSEARANAVKGVLVNQFGINPARISTVGYGFDRPIADNDTKEGQAMNRRVYATISGNNTKTVTQTKDMN
ncbi:OmpA/MotB protein [Moraxella macacae 0408225]|uniref:OmpA/MotB protein n=1 Tax=Moraxella macacae 0408225 TaxID=1230338 RepID=L2F9B6_9GAMM|nr:OmpA family protein [Moraxella macacae]ELA09371.1 OmpA/MotB protein [Moraxella macacae 0408225]